MKSEFLLARRYLRPRRNALSVITLLSILGVTLGGPLMINIKAVMTGFTDVMKEKLLETQAHIQMSGRYFKAITDWEKPIEELRKLGGDGAGVVEGMAMVQKGKRLHPKYVLGIDPLEFAQHIPLESVKQMGSFDLNHGEIVISTQIAYELGLRLGDKVLLHSQERLAGMFVLDEDGSVKQVEGEINLPLEFKVAGFYSFGKNDFDANTVFINRDDAAELYNLPWGAVTRIYGWVKDPFDIELDLATLQENLKMYQILSWKDLNRQMLNVLDMEKTMMFFLLVFIVLVAAFSITNTLISTVYQKTREIGILKALGASPGTILRIFLWQGAVVGVAGSCCGVLLGWAVIFWRNDLLRFIGRLFNRDFFPKEFYYFSEMPAHIVPGDVIFIIVTSIVLCTLGAALPAWGASRLDPAKALRYE